MSFYLLCIAIEINFHVPFSAPQLALFLWLSFLLWGGFCYWFSFYYFFQFSFSFVKLSHTCTCAYTPSLHLSPPVP